MTYREAKRLHKGDKVITKVSNSFLRILRIEHDPNGNNIFFYCSDGTCYHHTALR